MRRQLVAPPTARLADASDLDTAGAAAGDLLAVSQVQPSLGFVSYHPWWKASSFDSLRAALDAGQSGTISILGDSTGNAVDEWAYLFGQWLGTRYPNHRIRHRVWNTGTLKFDTPTIIQSGVGGDRYVEFDGTTTACSTTRDSTLVSIVGDLDVRALAAADVWTAGTLVAKFGNPGSREWRLYLSGSNLVFEWSTDGTNLQTSASASLSGLVAPGTPIWLRATLDVDNGSGGHAIAFYRSTDGNTWTQIGTTTTRTGSTTSIANTSANINVGARADGSAERFDGKVYEAQVRSGIDGTLVTPTLIELWEAAPSTFNGVIGGAPVIDIWNASGSGYGLGDIVTNAAGMYPPLAQSTTIISCSHNDGGRTDAAYWADLDTLLAHVRSRSPQAGVALTAQNPRTSPATFIEYHAKRAAMIKGYSMRQGCDVLDVYGAFTRAGVPLSSLLLNDGIHPSPSTGAGTSGSEKWRDVVIAAFNGQAI